MEEGWNENKIILWIVKYAVQFDHSKRRRKSVDSECVNNSGDLVIKNKINSDIIN